MRPESGIDQTSLAWLKPEIDASLARAGEGLERYAEEGFSGEGAAVAGAALHEVLGGLRMLELYGAAMVAEEMERLVSELIEGRVQRIEEALTSLLRAILQLPDYLERLQSGYRDVPIVLLPLLNDLRSCRGEKLLSESVLLIPAVDPELPAHLPRPSARLSASDLERTLLELRRGWQFALLQWFRGQHNDRALTKLADTADRLLGAISLRPARHLWWVAGALIEAMREHALDSSISIKLLFGRLDRELKRLIDQGETLYAQNAPGDLLRSLLYYAAQAGGGERVGEVRNAFGLNDLLPSAEEIDQARGALSGRNSSLLNSVVQALEEELLRVKDALDLFLRGSQADATPLQPELDVLDRVADTLGMLGMGIERSEVQTQRAALAAIAGGAPAGEHALLDIAGALLKVEASLQEHRERLGVQPVAGSGRGDERLSAGERRRLMHAVLREASVNLQQAKELFVAHLSSTQGNTHHLSAVVMLRDVAGALRLLEFEGAAERALALAGFLYGRGSAAGSMSAVEIDAFADALSGLEFYLEIVADHQGQGGERLQSVTDALARLGHWPPHVSLRELFDTDIAVAPESAAAASAAAAAPARDAAAANAGGDAPAAAPTADANAEAAVAEAERGFRALVADYGVGFHDTANADEEIRGTFLDELVEEIGQLEAGLPGWSAAPDDIELLRPIRRSFHTIKGSGRMVGARLLGEFAWQVESLLNRVLNGQRPASAAVVRLVEQSVKTLPEFHAALCGDVPPRRDVARIMAVAATLSEGLEAVLPAGVTREPRESQASAEPEPEPSAPPAPEPTFTAPDAAQADDKPAPAAGDDGGHGAHVSRLDPVLLDILRSEVAGHLGVIEAYLHDARDNSALALVPEHLLRAVHTLNGAFGAVELADVTVLTVALEGYVRRLRGLRRAPISDGHDAIAAASRWLGEVLDCLDQGRALPPLHDLPARLQALTVELPELRDDTAWLVGEAVPGLDELVDAGDTAVPADDELSALLGDLPELEPVVSRQESAADAGADDSSDDAMADSVAFETEVDLAAILSAPIEIEPVVAIRAEPPAGEAELTPAIDEPFAAHVSPPVPDHSLGSLDRDALRDLLDRLSTVPPGDVDADLAELFLEEARELLDRCEQHLARREQIGPSALSQELARELHTLKGGARMAGFVDAGELAHAMESLLEAAANDQRVLDQADLNLIGRCLDRLNHLIFPTAERVAAPSPSPPPPPVAAPPTAKPAADAPAKSEMPAAKPATTTTPAPAPKPISITPPPPVVAQPADAGVAEFVRVRADQLDSLVNLAGEVGIIRTRLEQQVGAFRFSLEEFEQTVQRLREQLRKLEIEAETQILSREVRVQEQNSTGFDPLEMDRFSQLQQLSRALAESMSDLQSIQGLLDEHTRLAESLLLQQSRAGAELQEGLMRARMVPFESMLPRLRRLVRQEAEALGKRVRLTVEGGHGELDRGVLERMAAPFEHMLRNALVHGLESPEERRGAGKSDEGEVRIRVAREATEVVIEVADDGRGIDPQRVRRTAIERGLLAPESELSDRDTYGFILEPGFSTASELTQYAGRGVGLDVVASEIKQLGGSLTIDSTAGQGASFRIRLPYTLAVSQAVLVRVGEHMFAVPMVGVQGIVRLSYANYKQRITEARPRVDYAGDDYEIYELDGVLGLPAALLDDNTQVPLLMVRSGDLRVALRVDSLLGGREIVVKPVGPQLARIPGVFGATILGDGAVVVILDVAALLRRAAALRERGDVPAQAAVPQVPVRQRPLVLVVDDSITMRKVSARVLEREGYEVHTAKDGMDALEQVHERVPDVILLDLEMPRMDGYEFAGYMRNDPRFRDIPIVVITSRVGEKHRARAFELGVNRYLGKPYQEADMLGAVAELLAERATTNHGDLRH